MPRTIALPVPIGAIDGTDLLLSGTMKYTVYALIDPTTGDEGYDG
jgi:hypothetical protein